MVNVTIYSRVATIRAAFYWTDGSDLREDCGSSRKVCGSSRKQSVFGGSSRKKRGSKTSIVSYRKYRIASCCIVMWLPAGRRPPIGSAAVTGHCVWASAGFQKTVAGIPRKLRGSSAEALCSLMGRGPRGPDLRHWGPFLPSSHFCLQLCLGAGAR